MEIEEDIPCSPLSTSLPRGARKCFSPKCSMKENISPSILRFARTCTGTIVDTVTQEPVLTGGQIGKIEELVCHAE